MQTTDSSKTLDAQPCQLCSIPWHVWFLGYGLGGCAGLAMIAGIWSLIVDPSWTPGLFAVAIAVTHATCMTLFWSRRSSVFASTAILICLSLSAIGLAAVAFFLTALKSHVPSLQAFYALAVMNFIMALVIPLTPKTKHVDTETT